MKKSFCCQRKDPKAKLWTKRKRKRHRTQRFTCREKKSDRKGGNQIMCPLFSGRNLRSCN